VLTVLMPSRGRERQAAEAFRVFEETKALPSTRMIVVLDADEPGYADCPSVYFDHECGMGNALNAAAAFVSNLGLPTVIGFVGDDHRFRTKGWDAEIAGANAAMGGGVVYGNDLIRGHELPSSAFLDARIVRALGWMALPGAKHLYFDDTWRELGTAMGRLRYLPNTVIEHMHPIAQKADWDENYARVNDPAVYSHDKVIYDAWFRDQRRIDAETALAALR
jgi:hypothetical protein